MAWEEGGAPRSEILPRLFFSSSKKGCVRRMEKRGHIYTQLEELVSD